MSDPLYKGHCLCGSVTLEVKGKPSTEGICHCASCRSWHAAPLNTWALWKGERFQILQGEELLDSYDTGTSQRHWCRRCGSGLFNRKPSGHIVIYTMILEKSGFVHNPSCHIHCQESVFEVNDDLPKYQDLPSKWGGSGAQSPPK